KVLLDGGAHVNACSDSGVTPLHMTMRDMGSHLRLARVLLDAGANIDSRTNSGSTPLHYAAQGRHLDVVRELINRGADVHARRIKDGSIPLHLAVAEPSVVQLLLDAGSDPNIRDHSSHTAL
ncbi:ankyrin, partial [Schizophyllum commune H4-8]|uniref:ankyrin n=1 Tax=Schizophyllum commune (strain H4-8 / FGSC 9210) TaxID=578458 RepID=UPI002160512F